MQKLREDVLQTINSAVEAVLPENAVKNKLEELNLKDEIFVLSIGKAGWRMAKSAKDFLKEKVIGGVVITKYQHSLGDIEGFEIYEAGHPVPDENTLKATERALEIVAKLPEDISILFLVSGGGSSLFEKLKDGVSLEELQNITKKLLSCKADITEINALRKRLSLVKGGKFAKLVHPRKIVVLVLSDVLGDRLDSIASGPAYPDSVTNNDILRIIKKYDLNFGENIMNYMFEETPKSVENAEHYLIGNVEIVCKSAERIAKELGYNSLILTTTLNCEAKEAGRFLASIGKEIILKDRPIRRPAMVILGGETVVQVKGTGLGGRNQELALSSAIQIEGLEGIVIASVGTDGTDGPTDAAGGIVDGGTAKRIKDFGFDPVELLENNDSYNALRISGDLLKTGPTGTNVNDLIIVAVK